MMNKDKIAVALTTRWAARELDYRDVVDSTNNIADEAGKSGKASGFLAVADKQEAGRGSRGRSWVSPSESNIFMSIMLRPDISMENAPGLTLVMALSVAEGIEDMLNDSGYELKSGDLGIKWPNDIVLNKRKICGILTELKPAADGDYYVVIGVGINVNQKAEDYPLEIRETAGSVFSETGVITDRSGLIGRVMHHFENNYEKYVETKDLSMMKADYEKRLININKVVKIIDPDTEYEATALGITKEGALVVRKDDGSEEVINAGEVSVRGLYGYV